MATSPIECCIVFKLLPNLKGCVTNSGLNGRSVIYLQLSNKNSLHLDKAVIKVLVRLCNAKTK